jgi:hypothetical protein
VQRRRERAARLRRLPNTRVRGRGRGLRWYGLPMWRLSGLDGANQLHPGLPQCLGQARFRQRLRTPVRFRRLDAHGTPRARSVGLPGRSTGSAGLPVVLGPATIVARGSSPSASAAHVTYGQQSLRDCPLRGMRRPSAFLAGASPQTPRPLRVRLVLVQRRFPKLLLSHLRCTSLARRCAFFDAHTAFLEHSSCWLH